MNSLPKFVVSTTLDKAEWNNLQHTGTFTKQGVQGACFVVCKDRLA